ncbi:MAG: hypothetical protein WAL92_06640 [Thiogranum sp.]
MWLETETGWTERQTAYRKRFSCFSIHFDRKNGREFEIDGFFEKDQEYQAVRIFRKNRAARVWRSEAGTPWLKQAPPKLSRLSTKGCEAKPYPISWAEQDRLMAQLPRHLADAALFAVNTGCREQEICQLRWDWEVEIPERETSVFILPASLTKTSTERVVVLNSIAARVIASRRGIHKEHVFTYRGKPVGKLRSNAWRRSW